MWGSWTPAPLPKNSFQDCLVCRPQYTTKKIIIFHLFLLFCPPKDWEVAEQLTLYRLRPRSRSLVTISGEIWLWARRARFELAERDSFNALAGRHFQPLSHLRILKTVSFSSRWNCQTWGSLSGHDSRSTKLFRLFILSEITKCVEWSQRSLTDD